MLNTPEITLRVYMAYQRGGLYRACDTAVSLTDTKDLAIVAVKDALESSLPVGSLVTFEYNRAVMYIEDNAKFIKDKLTYIP